MNTLVPTKHSSLLTKYARSFLAGLFVVSLVPWTSAQTPAADAFNPSANGPVYALAMQPDGSLLVGGNFSYIGGTYRPYLARFSTDGTLDSSFTPGITTQNGGFPCALAVQPDGKILVGGDFVAVDGLAYTNFARLTIDGSVDTNFLGQADGEVNTLAVQPDGKILVGGGFTSVGGAISSFLTRLNADGSRDTSFNPHITAEVYTINVLSDGKLLIGGMFTLLGGSGGPSYFARLLSDGSLDASFNPVVNYFVHSSAVQTDGKIVVGGR